MLLLMSAIDVSEVEQERYDSSSFECVNRIVKDSVDISANVVRL